MTSSKLLHRLGFADPSSQRPMWRLSDSDGEMGLATLAEEVPIAVTYNGRTHAVLMATPADLEDLAVGFSVSSGIVVDPAGVRSIVVERENHGIDLRLTIDAADADRLQARQLTVACGPDAINEAVRVPRKYYHTLDYSRGALWRASNELARRHSINEEKTSLQLAAWVNIPGDLQVVREDVSQESAVDKLLGAILREGRPLDEGFVITTSAANCEVVQKVAACGIELMASNGRPTGLAMRIAQSAGLTLVGLAGERTAYVYSVPARIT